MVGPQAISFSKIIRELRSETLISNEVRTVRQVHDWMVCGYR